MLVCKKNFGICAAAISGLIYATSPSIILQQKMVFLDHGVAFFSLLAVYALTMYSTSGCNKWWIFASVFAGLASLCKGTGISAVFAVAITIILNTEDMLKICVAKGISSLVIGGSLFLVYPLYGYIFNPKLLSAIVSIRSSTIFSAEWFVRSLFEYPWSYERIYDWFLLIGWVAVAYTLVISLREKRINTIVIWLACYLFTLVFIARNAFYYSQIVLYPFLSILIGKMSTDMLRYVDSLRFKRACVD
jgi:4-amino-4-deoxy-L-arabinose transferase-like glycosyltransferase